MAIRDILRKQDERFISLYNLLLKMSAVHGDTLQDSAAVLIRLLSQAEIYDRPTWYATSLEKGAVDVGLSDNGMAALRHVAVNGRWMDSDDIPF